MKKLIVLFALTVISLFIFTASETAKSIYLEFTRFDAVNNLDGVSMTVESISQPRITMKLENKSKNQYVFGDKFWMEKKIDGKWYQLPVISTRKHGFTSLAYFISSGGESRWSVDFHWLYGYLKTGEYRIVKAIENVSGSGDDDSCYLATEFTIN